MIGRLQGTILEKQPPQMLVDVHGVGYEVEAPMSTFYQLPAVGETVVLHTHMLVREDAQLLYGFASQSERSMFRNLIRINGVGAKLALTILSGISADEFALCVQNNDTAALVRLPGIGKKTAERLIIELRDKLKHSEAHEGMPASLSHPSQPADEVSEAVSALVALGYKPQEASRMVRAIEPGDKTTEDIIRLSLKSAVSQ